MQRQRVASPHNVLPSAEVLQQIGLLACRTPIDEEKLNRAQ